MQAGQQCLYYLALYATWLVQVQRSAHAPCRYNPVLAVGIAKAVEPFTAGKIEDVVESGHCFSGISTKRRSYVSQIEIINTPVSLMSPVDIVLYDLNIFPMSSNY